MNKPMLLSAAVIFTALSAGCMSVPHKQDTPLAAYNNLIVRPLNWKETITDKINGNEVNEYAAAQPELSKKFQAEFSKAIEETNYFSKITYGTDACTSADTVILEPKIATLDPGIRWVLNGEASYVGTIKTCDGKMIGTYSATRRVGRPIYSSLMGAIESLVTELGEDAGSELPQVKM